MSDCPHCGSPFPGSHFGDCRVSENNMPRRAECPRRTEPAPSKSVQKRIAAQKGEPNPFAVSSAHEDTFRELREARARIAALEAGVRKWASECAECAGKGYVYEGECITGRGPDDVFPEKVACDQCADIRALLPAKEQGEAG